MFELTEADLEDELNITEHAQRKSMMKGIKFLKRIYSKNAGESEYIRDKLIKFYEKNQKELFVNKKIDTRNNSIILKNSVQGN